MKNMYTLFHWQIIHQMESMIQSDRIIIEICLLSIIFQFILNNILQLITNVIKLCQEKDKIHIDQLIIS